MQPFEPPAASSALDTDANLCGIHFSPGLLWQRRAVRTLNPLSPAIINIHTTVTSFPI